MYESLNASGLCIAEPAKIALLSHESSRASLFHLATAIVVDLGHGFTHIIPIVGGAVHESCIKRIPVAGHNVTLFIQSLLRDCADGIPAGQSLAIAKGIKESLCYVCPDVAAEFAKHDSAQAKYIKVCRRN